MGEAPLVIRDAGEVDVAQIAQIYAHHVLNGFASFEEIPPSEIEMLARLKSVTAARFPYLVAERDGRIVGYSYASAYRTRSAYRFTVEDTVYVAEDMRGTGVGGALLGTLLGRCERGPWRQMVAIIGDSANAGSIALHSRFGFQRSGSLIAVGFKFGRWVDSVIMQRALNGGDATSPPLPPADTSVR